MTFIWPAMLFSLAIIPLFVGLYLLMQRRRHKLTDHYSNFGFVAGAKGSQPGLRRHIPVVFFLLGLTILAFALARPQAVVALPKQEARSSWLLMCPAAWRLMISNLPACRPPRLLRANL